MSSFPKYLQVLIVIAFTYFLNNSYPGFSNTIPEKINATTDTASIKYLPLAIGNVYKYHYASSNFFNYDYIVRIIKDTVINAMKYFVTNRSFPGYIGEMLRLDSGTCNFYSSSTNQYCSYSPYELLEDSLAARKNDTTHLCAAYVPIHICYDTGYASIFGNQVKVKRFTRNTSSVSTSVTYARNFGIIAGYYSDFWGMAGESLTGCFINGVLYGDTTLTGTRQISNEVPSGYSLSQNYPNPFNQSSIINFQCSMKERVTLKVYDIAGREVATLVDEVMNPGVYQLRFNGEGLTSSVYFYRMTAGDFTEIRKMVLLK